MTREYYSHILAISKREHYSHKVREVISVSSFTEAREACNMRQEDVALKLGIDRSTVSKWEVGKAIPRGTHLIKLAELYNCTTDRLLGINKAPEVLHPTTSHQTLMCDN